MKTRVYFMLSAALLAKPLVLASGVDWRSGPVSTSGGGNGVVLIDATNDLGNWITSNTLGNAIDLADPAATGTYYFGFDWTVTNNAGETGAGGYFGGLWMFDTGTERGGAGNSWTTVVHELAGPGFSGPCTPSSPYVIGTKARLILKITFNAYANDSLELWVNPIAGVGEGGQTGIPHAAASRNMEFTNINLRTGNGTGASTLERLMVSNDFESAAIWDGDNDSLPDGWERLHGLSTTDDGSININNGPAGDPDADSLTNLQEFQNGTLPGTPDDSDADGITNGNELTGLLNPFTGGVLGSPPGDPTNPYDADSDHDGIRDGEEIVAGTDTYVTDPNDSDFDDDGYKDGVEVVKGTNPTSGASVPTIANHEIIGIEHFDYPAGSASTLAGGEYFDFDNSVLDDSVFGHTSTVSNWTGLSGTPMIQNGKLVTTNGASIKREFNGPVEGNATGSDEREGRFQSGSSDVLYYRYQIRRESNVTYSGGSLFDYATERCFVGVLNDLNPATGKREFGIQQSGAVIVNGVNRAWSGTAPVDGHTYVVVAKYEFATGTVSIWIDPDLGQPESAADSIATMANLSTFSGTGIRFASGNIGNAHFDDVVISTTWSALSTPDKDTDTDGLRDSWETLFSYDANGTDNSADNSDADPLTAIEEQAAGTDPNLADTDFDTLNDDVEILGTQNPYTAGVLGTAPGDPTHPLAADSDYDGIADNEEIVVGTDTFVTNPNLADTDGDGASDISEITYLSDPTNALSLFGGDRKLIGADDFNSYADGALADLSAGTGFDFDNTLANDPFIGHTGTRSDYDNVTGAPAVTGGKLLTLNTAIKREFNGPGEGATVNGDEWSSRINNDPASADSQVVYLRIDMSRGADTNWSGISAYDFGTERIFLGVPGGANPVSGKLEFGISANSITTFSGVAPVAGKTYTLVAKVDYLHQLISLFINPDLTAPESASTAVATQAWTNTNWTTALRLASGGITSATEWDNLVVARDWTALGVFPGIVPDDYDAWAANYPALGAQTGFNDDPDGDQLSNGVESWLGGNPTAFSPGITVLSAAAGTATFTHTQSNDIPSDVTASYEWSVDLQNWFASGADNGAGVAVTVAEQSRIDNAAPALDIVTAAASVTTGSAPTLFIRVRAELGAP